MTLPALPLSLPLKDRLLLGDMLQSRRSSERLRLRCRIILMAADGVANAAIASQLRITRSTVLEWRRRFAEGGLRALLEDSEGGGSRSGEARAERLRELLQGPPDKGAQAWTVRALAKAADCSPATVQRLLEATNLRMNPRKASGRLDAGLLAGVVDLAGFYLHSPYHTVALEVDPDLVGKGALAPLQSPKPGEPAWLFHLHLRSIEGIRQLDGRSTHFSSNFWSFLSGLRPKKSGNLVWCISDTPLPPPCREQLEAARDDLRITSLDAGRDWLEAMKVTLVPALQAHIRQGRCPSLQDSIEALECFLREDVQDPLQWRSSA